MPGKCHWLFSHQFKNQVLRCKLVPNEITNGAIAFPPDCSHYFLFELHHRGRIISVRATPEDVYHMVNDYHIATRKSIRQYAEEFALHTLAQDDQKYFRHTFLEVDTDFVSECSQTPDGLEFIANQIISSGTVFSEQRDALIEYLRQIPLAEDKFRAGLIAYPIYVFDDDYRTGYNETNVHVWPNNCLTISYKPYAGNCKSPAPWHFSVKVKTLQFSMEDGEVISSEETKPASIPLSNKEMETVISGLSTQLEGLGFAFPRNAPQQHFSVTPLLTTK